MADTVLDPDNSVAAERDGHSEQHTNGISESSEAHRPISKIRLQAALAAIPKDRDSEMIADFAKAAASGSRNQIFAAMLRWVGIGDFYADPDREKNHPLASLAGAFKDDPEFERLVEQIALARAARAVLAQERLCVFLDSDILSYFLSGRPDIVAKVLSRLPQEVRLSSITIEEVLKGQFARIEQVRTNAGAVQEAYALLTRILTRSLEFPIANYPAEAEQQFVNFSSKAKRRGATDCRLIAHGYVAGAIIVTNNTADFEAIRDDEGLDALVIENWTAR